MVPEQLHPIWVQLLSARLEVTVRGIAGYCRGCNSIVSYAHLANACCLIAELHCCYCCKKDRPPGAHANFVALNRANRASSCRRVIAEAYGGLLT